MLVSLISYVVAVSRRFTQVHYGESDLFLQLLPQVGEVIVA